MKSFPENIKITIGKYASLSEHSKLFNGLGGGSVVEWFRACHLYLGSAV
jgi:hypothetical protein